MRIAIVEDNRDGAESLAAVLEDLGHDVTIATSGAEADQVVAKHDARVAFVDLILPGVDGMEVARRLRQSCPAITLVAVTGLAGAEVRERARAAGFAHFLLKPFSIAALESILNAGATPVPG